MDNFENETLQSIAQNIKEIDASIARAQSMISILREAGEETAQMEADLQKARIRREKWANTLKNRGVSL